MQLARLTRRNSLQDRRRERTQMRHVVGHSTDKHDAKSESRGALLGLDAAVHRDEYVVQAV